MRYVLSLSLAVLLAACTGGKEDPQPTPTENPAPQTKEQPAKPDPAPPKAVTVALEIDGMHCEGCVELVKETLQGIEGVATVEVSLEKHSASVTMKPGVAFPEAVARDALDKENYKLKPLVSKPLD